MSEDRITIRKRLEEGSLILDAFQTSSKWSIFVFVIDGIDIGASVIKSDENEANVLKVYRGYGEKIGKIRPENIEPIYDMILGTHNVEIMRFDENEELLDAISFKGEISKQNDVIFYGFRMECVRIGVVAIHWGD